MSDSNTIEVDGQRVFALGLAAMMILSGGSVLLAVTDDGLVAAEEPTVVTTSTDDTSTQSELTPGDTLGAGNNFTAAEDASQTIQYEADSNNSKLVIWTKTDLGNNATVFETTDAELVDWNNSDGTGNFNATFNHSALADAPMNPAENKTMHVKIINNTEADDPDVLRFDFYVENDPKRSVEYVGDARVADREGLTLTRQKTEILNYTLYENSESEMSTTLDINGSDTTAYVILANESVASDYGAPFGEEIAAADFVPSSYVEVGGEARRTFYSELGDGVGESTTYRTWEDDVGGEKAFAYHMGDDAEDKSEVVVNDHSDASLVTTVLEYGTAGFGALSLSGGIVLGAQVLVIGVPSVGRFGRSASADSESQQAEA